MPDDVPPELVTLVMDGADEHHGHVMARALTDKLDRFLNTFAGYERAYLELKVRRTDFEVARISHNSPTEFGLRPVARVPNHYPAAVVEWTLREWDKISRGVIPDQRIDEDLIGDVAGLARPAENSAFEGFRVGFGKQIIEFNEAAFINAERLKRTVAEAKPRLPWRKGVSHGTITGELRSVFDTNNERQLIVVPPVGPTQVRCVFTEAMRLTVKNSLWQYVKLEGLLHYDERGPHPFLVEVDSLFQIGLVENRIHLADRVGLFRDGMYQDGITGGLDG